MGVDGMQQRCAPAAGGKSGGQQRVLRPFVAPAPTRHASRGQLAPIRSQIGISPRRSLDTTISAPFTLQDPQGHRLFWIAYSCRRRSCPWALIPIRRATTFVTLTS